MNEISRAAKDILGRSRAELFFSGKIDFKSFLDVGNNRLFTLKEIEESLS